jgi:NADPH:quinone reductase-like Zn-dependent oxidoreductase
MFAAYAEKPNPEDPAAALVIGERPDPIVPEGWVRVRVTHASLNRHDVFTLMGRSARPQGIPFPITLGCDGAGLLDDGTPVALYPVINAPGWNGDEMLDPHHHILSEVVDGSFADCVVMPARNAIPLPANVGPLQGAVLGTAWLTAYRMLFRCIGIRPGETLLVQGASGGMATALVQLAAAVGVEVWVTSRSPEGRALAEKLGAARVFAAGQALPRAVDAVVDNVGAATWEHSLAAVRSGGAIGVVGVTTGGDPGANLSRLFVHQIRLVGSVMGSLAEMHALVTLLARTGLAPEIGAILPLEEARQGVGAMLAGAVQGKLVFTR